MTYQGSDSEADTNGGKKRKKKSQSSSSESESGDDSDGDGKKVRRPRGRPRAVPKDSVAGFTDAEIRRYVKYCVNITRWDLRSKG